MSSRASDLSVLDLLVLTFIDRGLKTTYDLQSIAGVSVGMGKPVLDRLENLGAIESAAETGNRGSRPYAITASGRELLKDAIEEFRGGVREPIPAYGMFEGIPRYSFLDWLWGEKEDHQNYRWASKRALERRIEDLENKRRRILKDLEERLRKLPSDATVSDQPIIALVYSWMHSTFSLQIQKANLDNLDDAVELLGGMPSSTLRGADFLIELKKIVAAKRRTIGQTGRQVRGSHE